MAPAQSATILACVPCATAPAHANTRVAAAHATTSSVSSALSSSACTARTSSSRLTSRPIRRQGQMRTSNSKARAAVTVVASAAKDPPTVADTKSKFLNAYPRPIPSIYNTVIQELLVLQHIARYNRTYQYDPVFALGFVTVYDQLMDGYPYPDDRDVIFVAYISALNEDPAQYRADAERIEKWASELPAASALVDFASRDGPVEDELKAIATRAGGKGDFHYSRFFAVGLFRLLELAKASDPAVLQQLCEALNVNKMSVNRDLDVYRGLLSKLTQAKDLLRDFLNREKSKTAEREKEKAEKAAAKPAEQAA